MGEAKRWRERPINLAIVKADEWTGTNGPCVGCHSHDDRPVAGIMVSTNDDREVLAYAPICEACMTDQDKVIMRVLGDLASNPAARAFWGKMKPYMAHLKLKL